MRLLLLVCFFLLDFTSYASSVKTRGVVPNHHFSLLSTVVVGSHGTSKWTQPSLVNKRRRGRAAAVSLLAVWQRLNQAGRGSYLTERTGRCTAKWLLRLTLSLPVWRRGRGLHIIIIISKLLPAGCLPVWIDINTSVPSGKCSLVTHMLKSG